MTDAMTRPSKSDGSAAITSLVASSNVILVVDDDQAFRELMVLALEAYHLKVLAARNVAEARQVLRTHDVGLLLLDLRLGSQHGIELLKEARRPQSEKFIPVLILTACTDRNSIMEIAALNVQGYLLKSELSRADLLTRVVGQLAGGSDVHEGRHGNESKRELDAAGKAEQGDSGNVTTLTSSDARIGSNPFVPHEEPRAITNPEGVSVSPDAIRPITTREQMQEAADRSCALKALSPTVSQLLSMTDQVDCSLEQISRVVKRDPAIALKVLRMANSVIYSRGGSVDTVQKALSRIGLSQVRQLVLNISVVDRFHLQDFGKFFSSHLFWEHSIATGLIAAAIARFRNGNSKAIDAAFTCGLLHDIARLVFADQLGEKYKDVLEVAAQHHLPLEQAETQMLRCNHAELMDRVLTAWSFPKHLIEPIAMHHMSVEQMQSLSQTIIPEVATLALANRLAHSMLLGSSGNDCFSTTEELFKILELSADSMKFIEERIPEETNDMKTVLLQGDSHGDWLDYSQIAKKRIKRHMRPLFLSELPAIDGLRILFGRLTTIAAGEKPNLAVLHVTGQNDLSLQSRMLLEAEGQLGLVPLPLLVISNRPFNLQAIDPPRRDQDLLCSPFTLSGLACSIDRLLQLQ